jgi:uncharacterized protein (TIGR02996 family)
MRLRLTGQLTDAVLHRMAVLPSTRAPVPAELLDPQPFALGLPAMDPEERRLLDAVLADPDADEPRARFADWCASVGDPRGEFIRGQVAEASGGALARREATDSVDTATTTAGCADSGTATAGLRPAAGRVFAPWGAKDLVYRRGFVESLSLSGRAFINLGASLFRLTPLREVRLVAVAPFLGELAGCPHLAHLARLDLTGNRIGVEGIRLLIGSPFVRNLRELVLVRNDVTAADLAGVPTLFRGTFRFDPASE